MALSEVDRFHLLARMLSSEDLEFLGAQPRIQKKFRRERSRIFRMALRQLTGDSARAYRTRLDRIRQSGQWQYYPALLGLSASTFYSLSALWCAGMLTRWNIPVKLQVPGHTKRLLRYLTVESLSAAPQS